MKYLKRIFAFLLLATLSLEQDYLDDKAMQDMLEGISDNTYSNSQKKIYFFKVRKPKRKKDKRDMTYFANIFKEFLISVGVRTAVYNWKNEHLVCIVGLEDQLDIDFVLNHFKDIIEDASMKAPSDFLKKQEM